MDSQSDTWRQKVNVSPDAGAFTELISHNRQDHQIWHN